MSKDTEINMNEEHPNHPGLTRAEVAQAERRAADRVAKARKEAALEKIADQAEIDIRAALGETERSLREVENLSPTNREMVSVTLSLPPQMPDIRIDGVVYRDRGTFQVPRAKAVEMLKIQYEGWRHESIRKGDDSYAFYAQMNQAARPATVVNLRSGLVSGNVPRGTH